MHQDPNNRLARRVVEEPKRSALPYWAVAIVAALFVWNFQQESVDDAAKAPQQSASGLTRPPPVRRAESGDVRTLFSGDDYPIEALNKDEQGTVRAELTIDAEGRVSDCTVVQSSGHSSLDAATCGVLTRRARFKPARDAAGNPIGTKFTPPPITWRIAE